MKRTDFSNLGGLKFTQNRMAFVQDSYMEVLKAFAMLCGDKSIINGVEVIGTNVTDGWISYNGEPVRFIGGSVGSKVVISEASTPLVYGNNVINNVHFDKTATCGAVGNFNFSELVPVQSLCNMWLPNDIKEVYVHYVQWAAFLATNFDANGYGLNRYKGWRIMSKAVPTSAGKFFINHDFNDPDFYSVGATGGSKTHTLLSNQQGSFTVATLFDDIGGGTAPDNAAGIKFNGNAPEMGGGNQSSWGADLTVHLSQASNSFSKMNPYMIILKLIKL